MVRVGNGKRDSDVETCRLGSSLLISVSTVEFRAIALAVSGDNAGHADRERQTTWAVCISQPSDAESRKTRLVPELHSFFVGGEIGFFPLFPRSD